MCYLYTPTLAKIAIVVMLSNYWPNLLVAQDKTDSLISRLEIVNGQEKAETLASLVHLLHEKEPEKALQFAREIQEGSMKQLSASDIRQLLYHIGLSHKILNNLDSLSYYSQKLLDLGKTIDDPLAKGHGILLQSFSYFATGDLENSISHANNAIKSYQISSYDKGISQSLNLLASCLRRTGDFDQAIEKLTEAIAINRSLGLSNSNNLIDISGNYAVRGMYKEGLSFALEGLEESKKENDPSNLLRSYLRMGEIHYSLDDYDESIRFLKLGLKIAQRANYKIPNTTNLLIQLASAHNMKKEYSIGLNYLNKSRMILNDNNYVLAYNYQILGTTHENMLNYDSAIICYSSALQLYKELGYKRNVSEGYWHLGRAYRLANQMTLAPIYQDSALHLANNLQLLYTASYIHEERYLTFQALGQYDSAFYAHLDYKHLYDSLYNIERSEAVAELQEQYQTKEQKQQIQLLEADQQIQQLWVYGLIGGLAFISIIAVLIYYLLSNRVKTKNSLLQQEKQLEEMKSNFFLNIAHELRTPLTLIRGPLNELMTSISLTSNQQRSFTRIQKNSEKLVDMAEEILQVSKMESEKLEIQEIAIPFKLAINKIFEAYQSQAESQEINYTLKDHVNHDFWYVTDKAKFEKILDVLLSNAFKYSRGTGTITFIVEETQDGLLHFQVKDTGVGIDKKDLTNVFKRYYQSSHVSQFKLGGVGIGLSLAQDMARALGGDITVESEMGKGTTFHVKLAKNVDQDKHETPSIPVTSTTNTATKSKIEVQNSDSFHVLVVEDDPDILDYIEEILGEDYRVSTATNGLQALDKMIANPKVFDLIISDAMMPEMDGFEFLEQIKANDQFNSIPFIMLTAMTNDRHRIKALTIGVRDYLTKPFTAQGLKATCAHHLSKQQTLQSISSNDGEEWLQKIQEALLVYRSEAIFEVEVLAAEQQLTPEQFKTRLHDQTGMSPETYFLEVKLQEIRRLIDTNSYYVLSDLIEEFGFNDTDIFIKDYNERFGTNLELTSL